FVSRSSFEKPRPFERCSRTSSPSSHSTLRPRRSSSGRTSSAMVVLPAPDKPVNHSVNPSVIALLDQRCIDVDATLELVAPGPAPRTLVLARLHGTRARDAADRRVARVVQRVVRNLLDADVRLDALRIPVDERLHFPDAVALRPLDLLGVRARRRLLATDARDPRVVLGERALERLDLADVTTAVRLGLPQPIGRIDGMERTKLEPVALDEPVARLVRLRKEDERVELHDRDVETELADHVHERGRLPLPRAGQAHPIAELRVRPEEHVLRGHRLDVRELECRRARQAAPP